MQLYWLPIRVSLASMHFIFLHKIHQTHPHSPKNFETSGVHLGLRVKIFQAAEFFGTLIKSKFDQKSLFFRTLEKSKFDRKSLFFRTLEKSKFDRKSVFFRTLVKSKFDRKSVFFSNSRKIEIRSKIETITSFELWIDSKFLWNHKGTKMENLNQDAGIRFCQKIYFLVPW